MFANSRPVRPPRPRIGRRGLFAGRVGREIPNFLAGGRLVGAPGGPPSRECRRHFYRQLASLSVRRHRLAGRPSGRGSAQSPPTKPKSLQLLRPLRPPLAGQTSLRTTRTIRTQFFQYSFLGWAVGSTSSLLSDDPLKTSVKAEGDGRSLCLSHYSRRLCGVSPVLCSSPDAYREAVGRLGQTPRSL
jgi:hypothetical protein